MSSYIYVPAYLTQAVTPAYTYPFDIQNGSAGFSTSLLRSAYAGACLRIRRSSDNASQDIGFSGTDIDTASLLSFCGAGNGFVTTWYDQSGNGKDAIQASLGNQPQLVASGAVLATMNSVPALTFDGTNFSFGATSFVLSDAITASEGTAFTVFNPTSVTSNSATVYLNHCLWGQSNDDYAGHFLRLGPLLEAFSYEPPTAKASQSITISTNTIGVWRHTGGNLLTYATSSTPGATTASGNTQNLTFPMGIGFGQGTARYNGLMAAVLFYKASTTTNFTAIGQALAAHYGLTWT